MPYKMRDVLFNLLPPGDAVSSDDGKLMKLLESVGREFDLAHEGLRGVVGAIPSNEANNLSSRWETITKSKYPARLLASKGFFTFDRYVSNTIEHFKSLCGPEITITATCNQLTFAGVKNEVQVFCSGQKVARPLTESARDDTMIAMIEKIKHAHTIATYKETKRA